PRFTDWEPMHGALEAMAEVTTSRGNPRCLTGSESEARIGMGFPGAERVISNRLTHSAAASNPEGRMDQYVAGCGVIVLMILGLCMILWPDWIVVKNRDQDDIRPVTDGEIWTMRVLGAVLVAGCGYALYAILTGMPGAEFFPV